MIDVHLTYLYVGSIFNADSKSLHVRDINVCHVCHPGGVVAVQDDDVTVVRHCDVFQRFFHSEVQRLAQSAYLIPTANLHRPERCVRILNQPSVGIIQG